MNIRNQFLKDQQLENILGLDHDELHEVFEWGLLKRPSNPGVRLDDLKQWISVSKIYPGIFLQEKFASALLGLSSLEFRRRNNLFKSALTKFDKQLYWKHRLNAIYRKNLRANHIYTNLRESHRDFAQKLDLRLARCVVCKEKAVYTICGKCGGTVDPAHCEALDDGRPIRFRPAEVCFNCIRKVGLDQFQFFRDQRSVRASIERVLGPLRTS